MRRPQSRPTAHRADINRHDRTPKVRLAAVHVVPASHARLRVPQGSALRGSAVSPSQTRRIPLPEQAMTK